MREISGELSRLMDARGIGVRAHLGYVTRLLDGRATLTQRQA